MIKFSMKQLTPRQLVIAAGVISVLIAVLVYQYLSGMETKTAVETENVVVAAVDIPEKTVIKPEMLKVVAMPRESVPQGSYQSIAEVQGLMTRTKIFAGDAASKSKLIVDGKISGFVGTIPEDKRAISINISDTTGVSGFAQPGDFVDIMLISDKERKNTVGGRIFLQNIQLLAINKSENNSSEGDKNGSARKEQMATATMAVSPEEAVKLAVAQKEGELYLVLRPFKPKQGLVLSNDYRVYLSGNAAPAEAAAPAPAVSAQPSAPARSYEPAAQSAPASAQAPASYGGDAIGVIRGNTETVVNVK